MRHVTLPGGVWRDGCRVRDAWFLPVTGQLELRVAEVMATAQNFPAVITALLADTLERIGSQPVDHELVASLCVPDRHWLMLHLARLTGGAQRWLAADCQACGATYDLPLDLEQVPHREAAQSYPFVDLETSQGALTLRLPNGGDQASVVGLSEGEAIRTLLTNCVLAFAGQLERLNDEDLANIEAALESVSPDVATRLSIQCPECGQLQVVSFDPYAMINDDGHVLYQEVHLLASSYHWSEGEILALPRRRRHLYLDLVDRSRGLHG